MVRTMCGKVALVTGAGSGIGRASALLFAKEGAKVAVADIVDEGGQATVMMIHKAGGEAFFVKVDTSKSSEVAAMVAETVEKYGRLDYAHNNAGIDGVHTLTADYPEDDFDRVISVNLKGVWLCLKHEIPVMLKQGGGAIVNTSSLAGLRGYPTCIAYVAAKHAVVGMTKATALEYSKMGIRVNAVCPGYIRTPMLESVIGGSKEIEAAYIAEVPIGHMGMPEEIAEVVVWLCSDAASFVTGLPMAVEWSRECLITNIQIHNANIELPKVILKRI